MTYVEYKQLNPFQRFAFNFKKIMKNLPRNIGRFFKTIGLAIAHFFIGIGKGFKNYGVTFVKGDWATKLSYVVFGFGDIHKGKYYKGILYMLVEAFYVVFMVVFGFEQLYWLPSLGTHPRLVEYDDFGFEKVFVFDSDSRIRQLTNAAGEDVMMYVPDKHSGSRVNKWGTRGSSYANIYNMGSFDIVCEFAGVSEAFDMAMRETAAGGSIVTIGFYGNTTCDAGLITLKGLSVFGSIGGTGEFENVLDFLKLHGDKAERMVVAEYPLENASEAFTRNHSGKCQIVFE